MQENVNPLQLFLSKSKTIWYDVRVTSKIKRNNTWILKNDNDEEFDVFRAGLDLQEAEKILEEFYQKNVDGQGVNKTIETEMNKMALK